MILRRFGWLDIILIVVLIGSIVYSIPLLTSLQPSRVTIYRNTSIIAEYPLSEDKTFNVQGVEGNVIISIKNGSVFVEKSTCRHQICVRSGAISMIHGQILCVPNHLLILINSKNKKQTDLDAISR